MCLNVDDYTARYSNSADALATIWKGCSLETLHVATSSLVIERCARLNMAAAASRDDTRVSRALVLITNSSSSLFLARIDSIRAPCTRRRRCFSGVPDNLVVFEHSRVIWTARDSGAEMLLDEELSCLTATLIHREAIYRPFTCSGQVSRGV